MQNIKDLPDIEVYVKKLNWYLQEHYPANKKITAEEWNALFLALMQQGNLQEDTLEKVFNEILPQHVGTINNLIHQNENILVDINSIKAHDALQDKALSELYDVTQTHSNQITQIEYTNSSQEEHLANIDSQINNINETNDNQEGHLASLDSLVETNRNNIELNKQAIESNDIEIFALQEDIILKAYRSETTLKYDINNVLPSDIQFIKDGFKTDNTMFYNTSYNVPIGSKAKANRLGTLFVNNTEILDTTITQNETFFFKEGVVCRQNKYTLEHALLALGAWEPANNSYLVELSNSINNNQTEISNIKKDYATKVELSETNDNLQNQITINKDNITSITADYVHKSDNRGIDYLTQNTLKVTETGALVQTEHLKNINLNTVSSPRQSTPIPVVDNKARLFLPQEIATLRNLKSWKDSLLGEAINYLVNFSDFPNKPSPTELQAYLDNKWDSIGGHRPILDQTTMTDESLPLSYKWYVNENKWIYSRGDAGTNATNNIYDENGNLVTPGNRGVSIGSNRHFYIMYETDGEATVNGLDSLEESVKNNSSDIIADKADLANYKTTNNANISTLQNRATAVENRATTIEGILPNKVTQIKNESALNKVYTRNTNNEDTLLSIDSENTANSIIIRDANNRAKIADPTADMHIANKRYVDTSSSTVQSNLDTVQSNLDTTKTELEKSITTLDNAKVDKEPNKGLSTNDFNNTLLAKLNGIESGANKITALAQLTGDATHRTVTDTEKSTWNGKASKSSVDDIVNNTTKIKDAKGGFAAGGATPSPGHVVIGSGSSAGADEKYYSVVIGHNNKGPAQNSIIVGARCETTGTSGGVAIGIGAKAHLKATAIGSAFYMNDGTWKGPQATGEASIAIGANARATAKYAIQIGHGENTETQTLKVFDKKIIDAEGNLYTANRKVAALSDLDTKLDAIDYEFNEQLSFGATNVLHIGDFPIYDTNLTLDISSTTSETYHGTLIIALQNYAMQSAKVYGDSTNTLTPRLWVKVHDISGITCCSIYFAPPSWSKNIIHFKGCAVRGQPYHVMSQEASVPSGFVNPERALSQSDKLFSWVEPQMTQLFKGVAGGGALRLSDNPNNYDFIVVMGSEDNTSALELYNIIPVWELRKLSQDYGSKWTSILGDQVRWFVKNNSFLTTTWQLNWENSAIHAIWGGKI